MNFERGYWLPLFVAVSVGIHAGVLLLWHDGPGTAAKGVEIEVTIGSDHEASFNPSQGREGKRSAQPKAQYDPFRYASRAPRWQQGPTRPIVPAHQNAPSQNVQIAAVTELSGGAAPSAGDPNGVVGSQQSGYGGGSGNGGPVLRVTAGETPVHTVDISSVERVVPVPVRRVQFVRARPKDESNKPAAYPEEARVQRQQGTVVLKVTVSVEGRAESVEVILTSRSHVLDDAAMAAVREWSFEPGRNDAGPMRSVISVSVPFTL